MTQTKYTVARITPPLKWHGGKHYLAPKIVALMPPHVHYVEPFAGGLSVLLAKDPEGVSEVVNDIDRELVNFWQTIRYPHTFADFTRCVQAQPFCEEDWRTSNHLRQHMGWHGVNLEGETTNANTARAAWFFVSVRQSLAGRKGSFAPLSRRRTRSGMNEQASAWLNAVEGLPAVHARLRRVVVLNRDALDVIRQQDGPDTLFYLDPPYTTDSRTSPDVYAHEMTAEQHQDLLDVITAKGFQGKVMLSGYDNPMYAAQLASWTKHTFDLPNNAAGGGEKRRMVECLWCNF